MPTENATSKHDTGQINLIPKPELRGFGGDYLTKTWQKHDKPGNSASF